MIANKLHLPRRQKNRGQPIKKSDLLEEIPMVPRLVGYARVSTAEQRLDVQLAKLIETGVDKDVDLFHDKLSATNARRPYFNLMRKHLQRGDTLLVYSVSRLFRDAEKLLGFFGEMKAKGVEIKSLTESLDLRSSHGRMIATILAAVDQNERERIRERTVHGMAELKRQGMSLGRPRKIDDAKAARMRKERKYMNPKQLAAKYNCSVAIVNKIAPKSASA